MTAHHRRSVRRFWPRLLAGLLLVPFLCTARPVYALRQERAGAEEITKKLRGSATPTAAGAEEVVITDPVKAELVSRYIASVARQGVQGTGVVTVLLHGPNGQAGLDFVAHEAVPEEWPAHVAAALAEIGLHVDPDRAPTWLMTVERTDVAIAETEAEVRAAPLHPLLSFTFIPVAEHSIQRVVFETQQEFRDYPRVVEIIGNLLRGKLSVSAAAQQIHQANTSTISQRVAAAIAVSALMDAAHQLYALGRSAVGSFALEGETQRVFATKALRTANNTLAPEQIHAILTQTTQLFTRATTAAGAEEPEAISYRFFIDAPLNLGDRLGTSTAQDPFRPLYEVVHPSFTGNPFVWVRELNRRLEPMGPPVRFERKAIYGQYDVLRNTRPEEALAEQLRPGAWNTLLEAAKPYSHVTPDYLRTVYRPEGSAPRGIEIETRVGLFAIGLRGPATNSRYNIRVYLERGQTSLGEDKYAIVFVDPLMEDHQTPLREDLTAPEAALAVLKKLLGAPYYVGGMFERQEKLYEELSSRAVATAGAEEVREFDSVDDFLATLRGQRAAFDAGDPAIVAARATGARVLDLPASELPTPAPGAPQVIVVVDPVMGDETYDPLRVQVGVWDGQVPSVTSRRATFLIFSRTPEREQVLSASMQINPALALRPLGQLADPRAVTLTYLTPADLALLTAGEAYSLAVTDSLRGQLLPLIVSVLRYTDAQGRDRFAIFV